MKFNRLICITFIIGSGVFASYFGGNFSYALFYLSLLLPVISFLYTVYVYFRFKLYQTIDNQLVVKGDWNPYSFIIANEDFLTYRNVKVNFLRDKSTIEAANQNIEYSLLPSEKEQLETRMKCNYRGEYYVGVDTVEVTDFLYLFTITYPLHSKIKATVLPRVVELDQLGIAPPQNDTKNPMQYSNSAEEELDTEVRKYYPGDLKKRIHWKASARMHELITRKYQHIPKEQIVIFMDLVKIKKEELEVVIIEDKIIECVLAITNYYAKINMPSQIIYEMGSRRQVDISSKEDFNAFYKACASIRFQSTLPMQELIKERMLRREENLFCVAVTHMLTRELYMSALQAVTRGSHFSILLVSDDTTDNTKHLIEGMKISGVSVLQIMSEDEISSVLSNGAA